MVWQTVLRALWLFLPAYVANMSPVFVAKIVPRWKAPIDGGRRGHDGKPLLGPGKTWRGLAGGTVVGGLVALLMAQLAGGVFDGLDFALHGYDGGATDGDYTDTAPSPVAADLATSSWWAVFLFGAVMGAMALLGDAVKSYFKRRRGVERGQPWVPFDQLDFVVFGLAGTFLASPLLPEGWVRHAYLDHWLTLTTIIVLTPGLHYLVNVIGYRLKLKDVPW